MGASVEKEGEWSVVGGTGEFTMAHGIIRRTVHEKLAAGEILELTIRGFCITPVRRVFNLALRLLAHVN